MDETIDMSGFYTDPWAGSYDTSMSNFDPALFDTSSLGGALGGYDFASLFGDPTGGMDYSSLFGVTPDYMSMYTDPYTTDTAGISYTLDQQPSLWDTINGANAPIAQSLGSSVMPNVLSGDYGQSNPNQSYVDQFGGVVGIPSSGADVQNPYSYATGPSGDTYVVDSLTGKAVGYLDSSGQPMMYGDVALQNGATLGDITNGQLGQSLNSAATQSAAQQKQQQGGGAGGGGGPQQKQQTPTQTPVQSGLGMAALIAQLMAALGAKGVKPPKPDAANNRGANAMTWKRFAEGGQVPGAPSGRAGALGLLRGYTAGQSDQVPAKVSHGEYVMDADVVAALGDGNTEAGAAKLDEMRHNIRKHKRSAPASKIPPQAKSPLAYMKGSK